jgi:hypothetical protein
LCISVGPLFYASGNLSIASVNTVTDAKLEAYHLSTIAEAVVAQYRVVLGVGRVLHRPFYGYVVARFYGASGFVHGCIVAKGKDGRPDI